MTIGSAKKRVLVDPSGDPYTDDNPLSVKVLDLTVAADTINLDTSDLETLLDGVEGALSTISTRLGTLETYNDTVETLIAATNAALTDLKTFTDGLEGLVTSSNTKLDTLAGHVDGLEGLLTTLGGYQDGLEGLIGTTNSTLTTLDGRVDGLEALITTLNGYADTLEALIGTTNSTLSTLDGRVDGLEALVTTLNGYVDGLEALLTPPTYKSANGVATASGDNVCIAGVASKKLRGVAYAMQVQEAGTRVKAQFQDNGTATNRTMGWMLYMSSDDTSIHGLVRAPMPLGGFYFETDVGVGLDLNLSAAIDTAWEVQYIEI